MEIILTDVCVNLSTVSDALKLDRELRRDIAWEIVWPPHHLVIDGIHNRIRQIVCLSASSLRPYLRQFVLIV